LASFTDLLADAIANAMVNSLKKSSWELMLYYAFGVVLRIGPENCNESRALKLHSPWSAGCS
jgi:hypothetical protein